MNRIAVSAVLILFGHQAMAVTSPFTFQGSLEDAGIPANGSYDLQFVVKTAGGSAQTPVTTLEDISVVNGVFTVQLDFGEAVFSGADRRLGVSVRPGASSGAFVALSPDLPMHASPYALTSNYALSAAIASDVTDFAIDAIDINVSAVTTEKIQNDAVTADKLASNSVSIASFTGGSGTGSISYTIGANDCDEVNISFGGITTGDFVLLNTGPMPEDVLITALNAPATNTMRIKICNVGPATQTLTNLSVRFVSFR
jgi:hypothetical protein